MIKLCNRRHGRQTQRRLGILCTLALLLLSSVGETRVEIVEFEDPQREALYKQMIRELRCLVCQNQNLADSNAELAVDLRRRTRELIDQGFTREEITKYMVDRYGDFVMYRPAFNASTFALWFAPAILLGICILVVFRLHRRKASDQDLLSAADRAMARQMMDSTVDTTGTPDPGSGDH